MTEPEAAFTLTEETKNPLLSIFETETSHFYWVELNDGDIIYFSYCKQMKTPKAKSLNHCGKIEKYEVEGWQKLNQHIF